MKQFQAVVIGAGIIGLAIAKKLAASGKKTLVLEANKAVGLETSFRNSAVIHAGIYYPSDSLKAKLCAVGRQQLYNYCETHHVPYKKIGKLIVATTPSQLPQLEKLLAQAQANGVMDAHIIDQAAVQQLEPHVNAIAALYSPSTGVVNGRELMLAYQREFISLDGMVHCDAKVIDVKILADGFRITTLNSDEPIYAEQLINAAGLGAQQVAQGIKGLKQSTIAPLFFAKGNYFKYSGKSQPFSRLIYPVPEKAGLGIHATLDVAGVLRFGPDVEWVDTLDYQVNTARRDAFHAAIKNYFPAIKSEDLQAEFAGIRPKSKPPEQQPQDFDIQSAQVHGIANLINLYGMESPGLTCSLAIADYVENLLAN